MIALLVVGLTCFLVGYACGALIEERATVDKLICEGYRPADAKAIARGPWPDPALQVEVHRDGVRLDRP